MLIGPQELTGLKSGCHSMAGKRIMKLSLFIAIFQCINFLLKTFFLYFSITIVYLDYIFISKTVICCF